MENDNGRMKYDKSGMPSKSGEPSPDRGPRQDQGPIVGKDSEHVDYPSLSAAGLLEIELPLRSCSTNVCKVEKLKVCDLGRHIARQTEAYLSTSPAEAVNTLSWYVGCCRGQRLLDDTSLDHLQKLTRTFSAASDPAQFFADEIQPFLVGLTPGRRQP